MRSYSPGASADVVKLNPAAPNGRPNAAATSGLAPPSAAAPRNTGDVGEGVRLGSDPVSRAIAHTCIASIPLPIAACGSSAQPAIVIATGRDLIRWPARR